ncbi:MAG: hypothetical protein QW842_06525, partial [Candidatus Nezhaarchaeales archaeon]
DLITFAEALEAATKLTIEDGMVTQDLARVCEGPVKAILTTEEFIEAVRSKLNALLPHRR